MLFNLLLWNLVLSLRINRSINFLFSNSKRMRVATKDQSVIESAARNCSKLTAQKLPRATMKKKNYMNSLSLHKICCFFPSNDGHKSLFTHYTKNRKKTQRYTEEKLHKKLPSQTEYKNRDICILYINQFIFYLPHVTIISEFCIILSKCLIIRK